MEIIKVVVKGELPENCIKCIYGSEVKQKRETNRLTDGRWHTIVDCAFYGYKRLIMTNKGEYPESIKSRPDWCPLTEDPNA